MTQEKALYDFWNSFGIPAYPLAAVPAEAVYPYITYGGTSGLWNNIDFPSVTVWYRSNKLTDLSAKVREISDVLKNGGQTIDCDGGYIWINAGDPWCNYLSDPEDPLIKYATLNINLDYITV